MPSSIWSKHEATDGQVVPGLGVLRGEADQAVQHAVGGLARLASMKSWPSSWSISASSRQFLELHQQVRRPPGQAAAQEHPRQLQVDAR